MSKDWLSEEKYNIWKGDLDSMTKKKVKKKKIKKKKKVKKKKKR
mgnify:FL=1|tara:strand:- start:1383 stop:1514 length:132 start_codon:yes stop_codon:yes gene_type:complete